MYKAKITVELFRGEDDPMEPDAHPLAQGIITRELPVEPGLIPSVKMRNIVEVVLAQIKADSIEPQPQKV